MKAGEVIRWMTDIWNECDEAQILWTSLEKKQQKKKLMNDSMTENTNERVVLSWIQREKNVIMAYSGNKGVLIILCMEHIFLLITVLYPVSPIPP